MTPEKQAGLIYQMLFIDYFVAINTGLKETFISEKNVHFGELNN